MKGNYFLFFASFFIFLLMIMVGTAGAIWPEYSQKLSKSGNPGSRVVYVVDIVNDHDYPVDIQAVINI